MLANVTGAASFRLPLMYDIILFELREFGASDSNAIQKVVKFWGYYSQLYAASQNSQVEAQLQPE